MTLLEPHDNPWRRPQAAPRPADLCWLLEEATAIVFGVPPDELRARSRCSAQVAFARQSAMYLAHVVLGLNYREVGELFRRDRTTAAHACRRVEDRRDDREIDIRLDMLEGLCAEIFTGLFAPQAAQ
ncbi:MAG: helix-turn-helix domain-containing protein [Candidatus Binataceae bacterium]